MYRTSVSIPESMLRQIMEFKASIDRGLPMSDSDVIRQLLLYAIEHHPRPKK